jgi:transposase
MHKILDRSDRLSLAITAMTCLSEYTRGPIAGFLRGISTPTAFGLAVHDRDRCAAPPSGLLGFVSTERSFEAPRSLGSITKTGHTHPPEATRTASICTPR